MRKARLKGSGGDFYHCINRIIERRFILGEMEKERFRALMRDCEAFAGVRIVTFALMSNHIHLLVEVPVRGDIGDDELARRLGHLYSRARVTEIVQKIRQYRASGQVAAAESLMRKYTRRMGDISEFMKTLKQRFTQWYNVRCGRAGPLWESRFKSVLVEGRGETLATMAAYIDLNPVRAGMVKDPESYRFSGYGEAVAGNRPARAGLMRIPGMADTWVQFGSAYRRHLVTDETEIQNEKIQTALEEGASLTKGQMLHCRVRYFTDGLVLGGRDFVEATFRAHRAYFGSRRRAGARPFRRVACRLFTARELRRETISVSCSRCA